MSNNNEIINFYDLKQVKKYSTKYHNPNYNECKISHPFRMCVVAPSGTGKTNFILNLIKKMPDTYSHIYLCCKTNIDDEPLYKTLVEYLKDDITFYQNITEFPELDELKIIGQTLVIFDDCVNEKNLKKVEDIYQRGRKTDKFGISVAFLTQSYFKVPSFIRRNTNYMIILKLSGKRDMSLILSDFCNEIDLETLKHIYNDTTKLKFHFLKIDVGNSDINNKFSHNFNEFYQIE